MKNLLLLFFFLPLLSQAQDIVGTWVKKNNPDDFGIACTSDGSCNLINLENGQIRPIHYSKGPCGNGAPEVYLHYKLQVDNGVNYIEFKMYNSKSNKLINTSVTKYEWINNGELRCYLSKEIENKGEKSTLEYIEEYIRIQE